MQSIKHDSQQQSYRWPQGARPCAGSVRLRLSAPEGCVCTLRLWSDEGERKLPMSLRGYMDGSALYETTLLLPEKPQVLWYYFIIQMGEETIWYGNNVEQLGGEGQQYPHQPPSFQITVYDREYQTPEWMHDGVMYLLDANGALKERTLSGEESELMEGVADFCLDVQGNALLCVTQEGVVSFGIDTGRTTTLYAGSADQAVLCADILLVRSGGSILRVADGQTATIRRDGATLMGVYGQKVIQLTGKGVMTCDVNGENATTILYGAYETMSAANGVLYVGDGKGIAQQVAL